MGNKPNKKWGSAPHASSKSKVVIDNDTGVSQILRAPYDINEQQVFEDEVEIKLACQESDVPIYYTIDGSDPGSHSLKYENPFIISKTTRLKARAIGEEGTPGLLLDQKYYQTIDLTNSEAHVSMNPSFDSGNKNGQKLVDGNLETNYHGDKNWEIFNGEDLELIIDLGRKRALNSFTVSYLDHTVLWIFPPKSVRVFSSSDGENYECIAEKKTISSPPSFTPLIKRLQLDFSPLHTQYLKVEIENFGEIPKWHKGGGHLARLYVGEIFVK